MREVIGGDLWTTEADCLVIPICWVRKGRAPYVMFIDSADGGPVFAGFPTKHDWHDRSDLDLIEQSARELAEVANLRDWQTVALPRVGCGLGQRDWKTEVKPILEQYLDSRFIVVDHQPAPSAGIEGE